ncbi:MAG: flagellin [Desulfurococcaceae archaeon]
MGESTTITHALLTIVAVILASLFAVTIMGQLNYLANSISIAVKNRSDSFRLGVSIIYAYYNGSHVVLFLKNTGDLPYTRLDSIDIFVKDYANAVDYYSTGNPNVVLVEYGTGKNVLEPSETVEVCIDVSGKSYVRPIEVRLVLVNGYTTTYVITE